MALATCLVGGAKMTKHLPVEISRREDHSLFTFTASGRPMRVEETPSEWFPELSYLLVERVSANSPLKVPIVTPSVLVLTMIKRWSFISESAHPRRIEKAVTGMEDSEELLIDSLKMVQLSQQRLRTQVKEAEVAALAELKEYEELMSKLRERSLFVDDTKVRPSVKKILEAIAVDERDEAQIDTAISQQCPHSYFQQHSNPKLSFPSLRLQLVSENLLRFIRRRIPIPHPLY
ncbi:unnamed protein product [Penicillium pancosmium]